MTIFAQRANHGSTTYREKNFILWEPNAFIEAFNLAVSIAKRRRQR